MAISMLHSLDYVVHESRPDRFVAKCKQFESGCEWGIRASLSKIRNKWEIKKITGDHTCITSVISQDHEKLDSSVVVDCIVDLVNANPNIPIKALVAETKTQYGFSITYRKAWIAKQKAIPRLFGGWEESYNLLPTWLVTCNPTLLDGTFLTGKYCGTLLVAVTQDGNRDLFPIAFAIVEGETKEAWMWFLYNLRRFVTPQPNLCIISDRGSGLLAALQDQRVGWVEPDAQSVYCIRHIASNFNQRFKNDELKKYVINMGYERRQPRFEAKLIVLRSEFPEVATWLDNIPREKWTQAYDGGSRYGHMTTNLAECLNSVLKGARALPLTALVKTTFYKWSSMFVDGGIKIRNMMEGGHEYWEELTAILQEKRVQATSHYVHRFTRESWKFDVTS
ncbi:uncharacterized protein LOC130727291 [Lotus japonicus]|uniref:uncharacterized protein LOC130727291 n=1 Tax=Lotus japonicus TaxID=34305 RepID=UPI00258D0A82|nr:uncharacterized protein LOC130727291 [Lotus japonicus]